MAIEIVRIPSETPNISNFDDFIGLRYAYGNQNGYVIDKGNECSYTINGSVFKINSGRLVIQGVECDIDANGINISVDNISTKRYYSVYLQINLALLEVKVVAEYDTVTYPNIDIGDDFNKNSTGIARMEIYRFTATSGIISDINKIVQKINYVPQVYVDNSKKVQNIDFSENSPANFGEYHVLKERIVMSTPINISGTIKTAILTDTSILNRRFKIQIQTISGSYNEIQKLIEIKTNGSSINYPIYIPLRVYDNGTIVYLLFDNDNSSLYVQAKAFPSSSEYTSGYKINAIYEII